MKRTGHRLVWDKFVPLLVGSQFCPTPELPRFGKNATQEAQVGGCLGSHGLFCVPVAQSQPF